MGAFLSLLGIVLLVAKLKNQIATSQRHFFEGKYFELIKLHRDNAAELELQEANGRRLFVLMVRELRCALAIIQQTARDMKAELTNEEALQIAYYCVYFGVGPNSSRILLKSLPAFPSKLVNAIEEKIRLPIGCFGGVF